jgi:hypothetical protein
VSLTDLLQGAGGDQAAASTLAILASLCVTVALTGFIGLTYRHTHVGPVYTQGFVHTLILVGLVSTVVLHIVGQNVAAAFAIFGAFSIIRFRNAVPETRDVGFIFLSMVVGLAAGGGATDVAILATVVICAVMYALWRLDLFAPERPSHILRIRVTNDVDFSTAFEPAFARCCDRTILHRVESVQGGMLTEITYGVRLREEITPSSLIHELQEITGNNRVLLVAEGPELQGRY